MAENEDADLKKLNMAKEILMGINKEQQTAHYEIVVRHIERREGQLPDSIEIGSAAKGGAVKVYGDAENVEDWKKRISNALEALKHARDSKAAMDAGASEA
jgi:arabinogalactan endo-1,4-beta-galactosidase